MLAQLLQPGTGSERRGSARGRLFTLVRVGNNEAPLWAWDISLSGIQCKSKKARFPGTYLDLRFTLPGTCDEIHTGGQVLSIDEEKDGAVSLGIRFCRLAPGAQLTIYRFLDARRHLWAEGTERQPPAPAVMALLNRPRPFAPLLREAYTSLQEVEPRASAAARFWDTLASVWRG